MSHAGQLQAEQNALEQIAYKLGLEIQKTQAMITEAAAAIEAIHGVSREGECQTLVPIGLGAMLKARISSSDTIPVGVGAGVVMEKSPDSAVNYLESMIKDLEIHLSNTAATHKDIAARIEQNIQQLTELAGRTPQN